MLMAAVAVETSMMPAMAVSSGDFIGRNFGEAGAVCRGLRVGGKIFLREIQYAPFSPDLHEPTPLHLPLRGSCKIWRSALVSLPPAPETAGAAFFIHHHPVLSL